MIIDISDIISCENKEVTEEVQIGQTSINLSGLGEFPIIKQAPVELRVANQDGKRILIQGAVDFTVLIPCGRCLEEVPTEIHFEIDKEMKLENAVICDEEADEADYLAGAGLDVDKLICEEILLNWPMKVLCKEDCRGICKVCGTNLNQGDCNCQKTELDPRMAAFQDVFDKFKEV